MLPKIDSDEASSSQPVVDHESLALIISRADWSESFQASQIIPSIKCRNDTTRKVSNCWIELEM